MSRLVAPMPGMSIAMIAATAEAFLGAVAPEALSTPTALDVPKLLDDVLPSLGIHITPGGPAEMGDNEGLTYVEGPGPGVEVLIEHGQWLSLYRGGRAANRARGTVSHELGHVVLHIPIVRRRQALPGGGPALHRVATAGFKVYNDAEWQAWTFAGCILMPRTTLLMLDNLSPENVADVYGVSEAIARNHLRRLAM